MSGNSRKDTKNTMLMPCCFERAMRQLVNWGIAAQKLYPNKEILTTKINMKAAHRKSHRNPMTVLQKRTQLPSKGLTLMMPLLTFGSTPCP
jgi:hypothetical protein